MMSPSFKWKRWFACLHLQRILVIANKSTAVWLFWKIEPQKNDSFVSFCFLSKKYSKMTLTLNPTLTLTLNPSLTLNPTLTPTPTANTYPNLKFDSDRNQTTRFFWVLFSLPLRSPTSSSLSLLFLTTLSLSPIRLNYQVTYLCSGFLLLDE